MYMSILLHKTAGRNSTNENIENLTLFVAGFHCDVKSLYAHYLKDIWTIFS